MAQPAADGVTKEYRTSNKGKTSAIWNSKQRNRTAKTPSKTRLAKQNPTSDRRILDGTPVSQCLGVSVEESFVNHAGQSPQACRDMIGCNVVVAALVSPAAEGKLFPANSVRPTPRSMREQRRIGIRLCKLVRGHLSSRICHAFGFRRFVERLAASIPEPPRRSGVILHDMSMRRVRMVPTRKDD